MKAIVSTCRSDAPPLEPCVRLKLSCKKVKKSIICPYQFYFFAKYKTVPIISALFVQPLISPHHPTQLHINKHHHSGERFIVSSKKLIAPIIVIQNVLPLINRRRPHSNFNEHCSLRR
uniref:Ovule protein n=1 Tax=Panagrellus redivivus TaxID=6233 RepID=A0A7E5A1Z3_PANRE